MIKKKPSLIKYRLIIIVGYLELKNFQNERDIHSFLNTLFENFHINSQIFIYCIHYKIIGNFQL